MKRLLLAFLSASTLAFSASAQQHSIADGVIVTNDLFNTSMVEGVSCFRIPAIVTAKNGDLIAAIDERVPSCGDLIYSRDINIVIRRSKDNGKTWGEIERAIDFEDGKAASDPSLIVDSKTGDIFLFYNYMDHDLSKGEFRLHVAKSTNNGKTWGEPVDITSQIAKPEWKNDFKFITSGRGIYTSDGRILHTMVNLKNGLHVFGSDDHGKSWYLIDTAITPGDESKIIELADGSWMINSRVNGQGYRHSHISTDEGKTWISTHEKELIDPSCNASIIRYSSKAKGDDKDRLLFSNAASANGRQNLTVRVSYDEGKTWNEGKVVFTGGSAYSSLTVLKNGDIAVFFEKDNYKSNEVTVFTLDWLTDGADKGIKPKK
ncbi:MAG: sialidase family protein [Rikenellaceae bacterium]